MTSKLPYIQFNEVEAIDPVSSSKNWDRRRRADRAIYATTLLEHAATHLVEDQMSEGRTYWPGASDAVHLLRQSIAAIEADELMRQRVGRATASWLPKYVLARKLRDGISDA